MGEVAGIAYFLVGLAVSGLLMEVARILLAALAIKFVFRREIAAIVAFCHKHS